MALNQKRSLCLAAGLLVALDFLAIALCRGPVPKPDTAPDIEFSAMRARSIHERIIPATEPHPVGSVANQLVRDRLVTTLEELGLEVEIQSTSLLMETSQEQVPLVNILARLPGETNSLRPVLLVTHYDSCPQGPGASDAGACVAALVETARALRHAPGLKRPIDFLFTDGEERGLLGAQEFVRRHPFAERKPFVVNFDARGSAGASLMFETQNGNRNVVAAVAPSLGWPRLTNSLFVTVYRQLPNGTDFTVFNRAGCPGINFACVDGAHVYHRATDTLANVSLRTLQHHGEHALNVAKRIGTRDTDIPATTENAVFFDLFGLFVVTYPTSLSLILQLATLLLFVMANLWRGRFANRLAAILLASILIVLLIVAATLSGISICQLLIRTGFIEHNLTVRIGQVIAIYWLVTVLVSGALSSIFFRQIDDEAVWSAVWLGWSIVGVALAIYLPEVSFVCLVPSTLAAIISMSPFCVSSRSVVTSVGTGVLLLPVLHLLPIAMGAKAAGIICAAFSVLLVPLCPMFGRSVILQPSSERDLRESNAGLKQDSLHGKANQ